MAVYLASLRRMLARVRDRPGRPGPWVPAHGPAIEDPAALLEHYVAHRLAREKKIVAALGSVDDLEALLARAYDDTPRELWPLARLSLRAHLAKLRGRS
jgi:glyoxylase-like metal-dependent hydrolase (beta-lactamase superfamily II)